MAKLSTHVLDLSSGIPAAGVRIELHILRDGQLRHIRSAMTNANGRTELLSEDSIETGVYELAFDAAGYFRARGVALTDPPFLDKVVIRFGIADPRGDYHVPLLLAPYGYSTYRGS